MIRYYGLLLKRQKKDREARQLCEEFLAAREKHFQDKPVLIANALETYLTMLNARLLDSESEAMCQRALDIYQHHQPLRGGRTIYAL